MICRRWGVLLLLAIQLHSYGQKQCGCTVDTARILSDRNLGVFLAGLQSEQFRTSKDKKDIPAAVIRQLRCLTYDSFSLANPNEDYRCCCTSSRKLPVRRLIYFSKSKNFFIIAYSMGGIGTWTNLLMLRLEDDRIVDLWAGLGSSKMFSNEDVVEHIRSKSKRRRFEYHFDFVVI